MQSNKEYTEDDVTDEVLKGSLSFGSSEHGALDFPGLRSDIEAIERSFLGGLNSFFQAAEEMKNGFFGAFGGPSLFDGEPSSSPPMRQGKPSSSPSMRRGIPIEDKAFPTETESGNVDISGLAKDVWSTLTVDHQVAGWWFVKENNHNNLAFYVRVSA